MLTDAPPRKNRAGFLESDRIRTLDLPQNGCLLAIGRSIESAMKAATSPDVRRAYAEFLETTSRFYKVRDCGFTFLQPDLCESANSGRANSSGITVLNP